MASSLYLIFGGDEYQVSSKAREIISSFLPSNEQALGLDTIDANTANMSEAMTALDRCLESLMTVGFMGSPKVTWMKDANFFSDNKTGKTETVKSRVNDLAALIKKGIPENQLLVITATQVDKRFSLYKTCQAAGIVHEFAIPEKAFLAERQARETAKAFFSKNGLRIHDSALEAFLEKTGTDSRQMVSEVEKITLFLGTRKMVEDTDVQAVTSISRGALAWDLADAFGQRDLGRTLGILRQLLFQKESPIRLIIALQGRVQELMLCREAVDARWLVPKRGSYGSGGSMEWSSLPAEVEKMFSEDFKKNPRSIHPFRLGLLAKQAKTFSWGQLRKCHRKLVEAHARMVSGGLPQALELEILLVQMLS